MADASELLSLAFFEYEMRYSDLMARIEIDNLSEIAFDEFLGGFAIGLEDPKVTSTNLSSLVDERFRQSRLSDPKAETVRLLLTLMKDVFTYGVLFGARLKEGMREYKH